VELVEGRLQVRVVTEPRSDLDQRPLAFPSLFHRNLTRWRSSPILTISQGPRRAAALETDAPCLSPPCIRRANMSVGAERRVAGGPSFAQSRAYTRCRIGATSRTEHRGQSSAFSSPSISRIQVMSASHPASRTARRSRRRCPSSAAGRLPRWLRTRRVILSRPAIWAGVKAHRNRSLRSKVPSIATSIP